jgi:hypothetical protein
MGLPIGCIPGIGWVSACNIQSACVNVLTIIDRWLLAWNLDFNILSHDITTTL